MSTETTALQNQAHTGTEGEARPVQNRPVYTPAVDVIERDDAFEIVADMPGVRQDQVEIQLDEDVLRIAGRRSDPEWPSGDLLYKEFDVCDYERSFTITAEINRDAIKATIKHGVLHIALPKAEKAQPRKISVQTE